MSGAAQPESSHMNQILDRLGVEDVRAVPGTSVEPTFYAAFTALIDRVEHLEYQLDQLRTEVRYPDGDPSND